MTTNVMTPEQCFAQMVEQGDVVLERFDDWVRRQPDKLFIDYGEDDVRLTYAQFARQADAVAAGLSSLGAVAGDRVSVMTRNSLVATLVMFACWRVGAVPEAVTQTPVVRVIRSSQKGKIALGIGP